MKLTLSEWHRETFAVHLQSNLGQPERAELVKGIVSGPFGIYPGTVWHAGHESAGRKVYTLVHMPTQRAQFTLPWAGLCRKAAEELGSCDLAWESAWVPGLVGAPSEMEKAEEIHRRWKNWGER